jgi:hypothetical protein
MVAIESKGHLHVNCQNGTGGILGYFDGGNITIHIGLLTWLNYPPQVLLEPLPSVDGHWR